MGCRVGRLLANGKRGFNTYSNNTKYKKVKHENMYKRQQIYSIVDNVFRFHQLLI